MLVRTGEVVGVCPSTDALVTHRVLRTKEQQLRRRRYADACKNVENTDMPHAVDDEIITRLEAAVSEDCAAERGGI
jgi:hypothetical protein